MRITDEFRSAYLNGFAHGMARDGIPLRYLDIDDGGAVRWCASLDANSLAHLAYLSGDYWLYRWLLMASGRGLAVQAVLSDGECAILCATGRRPLSARTRRHLARVIGGVVREIEERARIAATFAADLAPTGMTLEAIGL